MNPAPTDLHDDVDGDLPASSPHAAVGPRLTAQDIARRFRNAEPTAAMAQLRALLERQAERVTP